MVRTIRDLLACIGGFIAAFYLFFNPIGSYFAGIMLTNSLMNSNFEYILKRDTTDENESLDSADCDYDLNRINKSPLNTEFKKKLTNLSLRKRFKFSFSSYLKMFCLKYKHSNGFVVDLFSPATLGSPAGPFW